MAARELREAKLFSAGHDYYARLGPCARVLKTLHGEFLRLLGLVHTAMREHEVWRKYLDRPNRFHVRVFYWLIPEARF